MNSQDSLTKLKRELKQKNAAILYRPLSGEIDFREKSFPLEIHKNSIILPADKEASPLFWAEKCKEKLSGISPYILIPGTTFDLYGTRHGKGGGWYDRFLSSVPADWLRIGVAHKDQLSEKRLVRKNWDQPVDWLIIKSESDWKAFDTKTNLP